jgi:hypothetical protein
MSKCNIAIQLEKNLFVPGEEIKGEIVLHALESFHCNSLLVFLEYFTLGQALPFTEQVGRIVLPEDQYQVGECRYPFSFQAPNGPFSYKGKSFSIQWRIRVAAEIAWQKAQETSAFFALLPPQSMSRTTPYSFGASYTPGNNSMNPVQAVLSFLAENKISTPQVALSDFIVCRGDTLTVKLTFSTKKNITLVEVFAELFCREVYKNGLTFSQEVVHQSRVPFALEQEFMSDAYRGSLQPSSIPERTNSNCG